MVGDSVTSGTGYQLCGDTASFNPRRQFMRCQDATEPFTDAIQKLNGPLAPCLLTCPRNEQLRLFCLMSYEQAFPGVRDRGDHRAVMKNERQTWLVTNKLPEDTSILCSFCSRVPPFRKTLSTTLTVSYEGIVNRDGLSVCPRCDGCLVPWCTGYGCSCQTTCRGMAPRLQRQLNAFVRALVVMGQKSPDAKRIEMQRKRACQEAEELLKDTAKAHDNDIVPSVCHREAISVLRRDGLINTAFKYTEYQQAAVAFLLNCITHPATSEADVKSLHAMVERVAAESLSGDFSELVEEDAVTYSDAPVA
jgi:hypothetical protein